MASSQPINITESVTLSPRYAGTLCTINAAAGLTITLPAATGSGRKYEFLVGTTVTSNNVVIQVANATDVMAGVVTMAADGGDTAVLFESASTSDTITMNGSTKGGIKGDFISLTDAQSGLWRLQMVCQGTGTEASPLSAAVS